MPHYPSPAKNPAPGSLYAFALRGLEILDAERHISLSPGPIEIEPAMTLAQRRQAEHFNEIEAAFRAVVRKRVINELRLAGMPEAAFDVPMHPATQALVDNLCVDEIGALDEVMHACEARPDRPAARDRIVFVVWGLIAGEKPTAAAAFLNKHTRDARSMPGLTRHHIRSAVDRYTNWIRRRKSMIAVEAETILSTNEVVGLIEVAQWAKSERVSMTTGTDLADHLDERFGLATLQLEALARLGRPIRIPGDRQRARKAASEPAFNRAPEDGRIAPFPRRIVAQ